MHSHQQESFSDITHSQRQSLRCPFILWLVLSFLFIPAAMAKVLPPGTYQDLEATEPLVLQNGAYVFVNLRMKVPGAGVGLDGRKATSLSLLGCRFEGGGMRGTGILAAKDLTIRGCHFSGLENGVKIGNPKTKTKASRAIVNQLTITANTFTNNLTGVYLDNGLHNLELKCNVFSQTTPIPTGNTHVGLLIGANASLFQNRIGGNNTPSAEGDPNSNYFPRSGTGLNAGAVNGYVSIKNESAAQVDYWAYDNELLGNYEPIQGNGANYVSVENLNSETFSVNDQNISDWCASHYTDLDCNYGSIAACEDDLLNNSQCTDGKIWVKVCTGGPIDNVSWPVARMAVDTGSKSVTKVLSSNLKRESSLGQSIPNPGRDRIVIPYFLAENNGKASLQIVEMATGKVVAEMNGLATGEGKLDVDVSRFSSGVFGYRLLSEKGKSPRAMNFVIIH